MSIENNFNKNHSKYSLNVSIENHNIKFVGETVYFIHQFYLNPNYISWGIMLSAFEGDIIQFKSVYGSEFSILVKK